MSSGKEYTNEEIIARTEKALEEKDKLQKVSGKAFPPHGYVGAESWRYIHERSDPGDVARLCPVKFIPHVDYVNSGEYFGVMSVEEHSALMHEKEKEIERLRAALEWYADIENWRRDINPRPDRDEKQFRWLLCDEFLMKSWGPIARDENGKRAREALACGEDE